jgi:hypothetical protein
MSYAAPRRRIPLLAWPIVLLWRLVTLVVSLTGILLGLVIGLLLMIVGMVFIMTFVGAIIGIPLFALGFLVTLRALY